MTDAELTQLLELAKRATPGPWESREGKYVVGGTVQFSEHASGRPDVCEFPRDAMGDLCDGAIDDAAFIAASRLALPELCREVLRLREALTPSAATKTAYIGEFSWSDDCYGGSVTRTVPWTTVKEIMAAIRKRAEATQ